jgi:hypothetical protein
MTRRHFGRVAGLLVARVAEARRSDRKRSVGFEIEVSLPVVPLLRADPGNK